MLCLAACGCEGMPLRDDCLKVLSLAPNTTVEYKVRDWWYWRIIWWCSFVVMVCGRSTLAVWRTRAHPGVFTRKSVVCFSENA